MPRKAPKNREFLKPVTRKEEAEAIAEDVIAQLLSTPQGGNPRRQHVVYLCRMYPSSLIYRALSIAKADYQGRVETTVTRIFVYELSQLVRAAKDLTWHKDVARSEEEVMKNNRR